MNSTGSVLMTRVKMVSLLRKLNGLNEISTLPYVKVVTLPKCIQLGR